MTMLIHGGRVIDPTQDLAGPADVLIDGGRIAAIGRDLPVRGVDDVFDASGMIVTPGLIDVHAHLRDPGFPAKETLESGARAAVQGGFTAVCCMPNPRPPLDTAERVADVVRRAAGLPARVFPIGAISVGREGHVLADLEGMAAVGAVGFSDDGDSTRRSSVMREALAWSATSGLPIMVHCEDPDMARGGSMHRGAVSVELGDPGIPAEAEESYIERDLRLAEETGGWLHVLHVSTARGIELVEAARARDVRVTAEVMPHHLLLTDEWVAGRRRFVGETAGVAGPSPDPAAKVNPPLRRESDAQALLDGLRDGTFDTVATDHAPHAAEDKPTDLRKAAFGMIGLEVAFPLLLRLVRDGRLSLPLLVDAMSCRPAQLFGLPGGSLRPGARGTGMQSPYPVSPTPAPRPTRPGARRPPRRRGCCRPRTSSAGRSTAAVTPTTADPSPPPSCATAAPF